MSEGRGKGEGRQRKRRRREKKKEDERGRLLTSFTSLPFHNEIINFHFYVK